MGDMGNLRHLGHLSIFAKMIVIIDMFSICIKPHPFNR